MNSDVSLISKTISKKFDKGINVTIGSQLKYYAEIAQHNNTLV